MQYSEIGETKNLGESKLYFISYKNEPLDSTNTRVYKGTCYDTSGVETKQYS